jgi:hypothetical protein
VPWKEIGVKGSYIHIEMPLSLSLPDELLPYSERLFLTPRSRILLEKLIVSKLVENFPAFNGARRFITMPQEPSSIDSILNYTNPIHTLISCSSEMTFILPSHIHLGLPSSFPKKILYAFLIFTVRAKRLPV